MRHTLLAAASALTLGLASAGCASAPAPATDDAEAPTLIEVENYNTLAVVVDAVSSGEDYRLGQVETTDTETFRLPPRVSELDLRILIDPVGSPGRFLSDELLVSPGDVVQVDVETNLDLTTVTVR